MTLLRDLSIIWSFSFTIVLFLMLFESRYSKRKSIVISVAAMAPLIALNLALCVVLGAAKAATLILLTCTLPSLVFFWFMAKHRDGRFLFTFCLADTIVLEVMSISNIIDFYLPVGNYVVMFVLRLILFPALTLLIYKKVRLFYLEVQKNVTKGWYAFAAISAIFYVMMDLAMSYPTMVTERPEALPGLLLLFLLMPALYVNIFRTLRAQQNMYEMKQQESILMMQVDHMTTRIEEFNAADEKFRLERHNFRHQLQAIAGLAEKGQYEELQALVHQYGESVPEKQVRRYCRHPVIDAVLSTYLSRAEGKGISVSASVALPDELPVNEAELATVFANAIENAVNACEKLEQQKRYIDIKVLEQPRIMIQVCNSFNGEAMFDEDGIPVSPYESHGFGTRSIVAFCQKNNAFCEFKAEQEKYMLRIALS